MLHRNLKRISPKRESPQSCSFLVFYCTINNTAIHSDAQAKILKITLDFSLFLISFTQLFSRCYQQYLQNISRKLTLMATEQDRWVTHLMNKRVIRLKSWRTVEINNNSTIGSGLCYRERGVLGEEWSVTPREVMMIIQMYSILRNIELSKSK